MNTLVMLCSVLYPEGVQTEPIEDWWAELNVQEYRGRQATEKANERTDEIIFRHNHNYYSHKYCSEAPDPFVCF